MLKFAELGEILDRKLSTLTVTVAATVLKYKNCALMSLIITWFLIIYNNTVPIVEMAFVIKI